MIRITRILTTFTLGLTLATTACAESGMYRMPDGRLLLTNFVRTDGVPVGETARRLGAEPVQVAMAAAPVPVLPASNGQETTALEFVEKTDYRNGDWYYIQGVVRNRSRH